MSNDNLDWQNSFSVLMNRTKENINKISQKYNNVNLQNVEGHKFQDNRITQFYNNENIENKQSKM